MFDPNVKPTDLDILVLAVDYSSLPGDQRGAALVVRGNLDEIISASDNSINLFLSPKGLKGLLRDLVEALTSGSEDLVEVQFEEEEATAQRPYDHESVQE